MKWEDAIKLAINPIWKSKMVVLAHSRYAGNAPLEWCYHAMRKGSAQEDEFRMRREFFG